MGTVDEAYGVEIYPVADAIIGDTKGYFYNNLAVVGDSYFDSINIFNGSYPGFPGYWCLEMNVLFGAEIVTQNAILKLVEEVSA